MFICEDKLVLYHMKKDTLFDIFQLPDCEFLYSAGIIGMGPNDFINIDVRSFRPTPNGFLFYDTGVKILKEVFIKENSLFIDNENRKHFETDHMPVNGFTKLNDSLYFYFGDMNNKEVEYALYNYNSQTEYTSITYPNWAKKQTLDQLPIFTYMKNVVTKPDGEFFVSFYTYFKRLRIYDQMGVLCNDIKVEIPPFNNNIETNTEERLLSYYGYPKTVGDYIYVFCKNAKYKNMFEVSTTELQVWKWDATPVATYDLGVNLTHFAISEKYHKIYAVDSQHEECFYVFDLPHF